MCLRNKNVCFYCGKEDGSKIKLNAISSDTTDSKNSSKHFICFLGESKKVSMKNTGIKKLFDHYVISSEEIKAKRWRNKSEFLSTYKLKIDATTSIKT